MTIQTVTAGGEQVEMSGVRKAAVLLVQMGSETASRVLAHLRPVEVEELTAEILRLRDLQPEIADEVVNEFHTMASVARRGSGGLDFAQRLLEASFGREEAAAVLERVAQSTLVAPFSFLHEADSTQILSFLDGEHAQTIALVLAHLRPEQSAAILFALPDDLQADVAHRVAVMERTSPDNVRMVEQILQRRSSSVLQPSQATTVGGVQPLVEIINRADRSREKSLLEGLHDRDPALADEIRARMFVFENITSLEDRAIQNVLRQVDSGDLATALKGVRANVRDAVLRNLSERARANVLEEIDLMGPIRMSVVEEAQAKVVQVIRALEESGDIVVQRGAGEDDLVS